MSKNFEEEYKALANEELPDLWDRIEAGLTPKTTALAEEEKKEQIAGQGKVFSFLYKYRTVAVAALCMIVILPAVIVLGRARSGGSKSWEGVNESAPMAADTTADEGWDEASAIAEESAEEAGEVSEDAANEAPAEAGGTSQEEMLPDEGAASGAAADTFSRTEHGRNEDAGAALPADMASDDAEKKMEDKVSELSDPVQGEAKKETAEMEAAARIYEKVTVKVVQGTGEMAEADRGLFYEVKMKVIKDPSGELTEGTELSVWIAVYSSMAYLEGEEYTLDLSYDPGRDCPYRIA